MEDFAAFSLTVDLIFSRAQLAELTRFAVLNLVCYKGFHAGKASRNSFLVFASSTTSAFKHVRDQLCVAVTGESSTYIVTTYPHGRL